ncbi:MAG: transcription antitermination factor NusB [Candidatus Omnitrophica bacterium]|nr:transcription antitermination factor NusB [Candidatus Omnitrophota bacterium]
MRKRTIAREYALQILYQLHLTQSEVDDVLRDFWEHSDLDDPEIRKFTEGLVRGTTGKIMELDELIKKYAENWHLNRMAVIDRNILRLAAYELLNSADVPPKVTLNEAVNLAKKFSQADSGKFVNGILDKISHSEKLPSGKEQ